MAEKTGISWCNRTMKEKKMEEKESMIKRIIFLLTRESTEDEYYPDQLKDVRFYQNDEGINIDDTGLILKNDDTIVFNPPKYPEELEGKMLLTYSDMMKLDEYEKNINKSTVAWGNWVLDESNPASLSYKGNNGIYWFELNRINTKQKLLKWLLHLEEKNWISSADLGNLVKAVKALSRCGKLNKNLSEEDYVGVE